MELKDAFRDPYIDFKLKIRQAIDIANTNTRSQSQPRENLKMTVQTDVENAHIINCIYVAKGWHCTKVIIVIDDDTATSKLGNGRKFPSEIAQKKRSQRSK